MEVFNLFFIAATAYIICMISVFRFRKFAVGVSIVSVFVAAAAVFVATINTVVVLAATIVAGFVAACIAIATFENRRFALVGIILMMVLVTIIYFLT